MTEGPTPPPGSPPPVDFGAPPPGGYQGPPPDADARTMAMLCHLLAIFVWFLGPLIIWLMKKDTSPFVDDQGKESLNFQLTMLIAHAVAGVLWAVCIGTIITMALIVVNIVFCIIASVQANSGVAYRYPINIRFIK